MLTSYMELNALLQQKKNRLRRDLAKRGIQKRTGKNDFDKYTYFSEAQYKALFTELFSEHGLELNFTEVAYETFDGTGKNANGRLTKLKFSLIDIETGYSEETIITGEGMDKGDKAGYKAYTGAMKYYLANTFLVATGDDPEKDSPDEQMNRKKSAADVPATEEQIRIINELANDRLPAMLAHYKVDAVEKLNVVQASEAIKVLKK